MNNTINENGQSAAKLLILEEGSTTSHYDVAISIAKWSASYKEDEDIVWTLNENLKKFNKTYNYLYVVTNNLNNDFYIGRHSTNNLEDNYFGSGKRLKNSVRKHNKINFSMRILHFTDSFKELVSLEKFIVNKDLIKYENCMNIIEGGLNPIMFGGDNPNFGKPLSDKHKKLLSENGKLRIGELNAFFNKKHTSEAKKKMSEAAKLKIGELNSFYGISHSEETKLLISELAKERLKNPEFREMLSNKKKIRYYHTPFGIFDIAHVAAKACGVCKSTILQRCVKNTNKIVGYTYQIPNEYKGEKTWREHGWFYEEFNND